MTNRGKLFEIATTARIQRWPESTVTREIPRPGPEMEHERDTLHLRLGPWSEHGRRVFGAHSWEEQVLLDLLSVPTSRRDWAVLISIVSLVIGILALVLDEVNTRSLIAAGALGAAIVLSIVSALLPRTAGIPMCVVSGLLPLGGLYVLLAPNLGALTAAP